MKKKLTRRDFVRATTAAGVAVAAVPKTLFGQAPTMMTPKSVKPCVVASGNGNRSKDDHGVACVELDPDQTGVGWSGLPNAEGVVQLDASCMHGPKKRAGAVAAIEGVRTPARVAQLVAAEPDAHPLVGKAA